MISILVLPQMDVAEVTRLVQLVEPETMVRLVGVSSKMLLGKIPALLSVQIDQALQLLPEGILVVPCYDASHTVLMTDPRIHRLVHRFLEAGCRVVVAAESASLFAQVGIPRLGMDNYHVVASLGVVRWP